MNISQKSMEYKIKVCIDTNILLDFVSADRERHAIAQQLFHLIYTHKVEATVSTQSVLDAAYLAGKKPLSGISDYRTAMLYMLMRTDVGYVDSFDLRDALENTHPDIEDSALISFAYDNCCDFFLTNDKELLSREVPRPMKVMTPEEFVDKCRA